MTTTRSFRIYEILQRRFKNNDGAKVAISLIKKEILTLRIDIEKRFYNNLLLNVGTGISVTALILSSQNYS